MNRRELLKAMASLACFPSTGNALAELVAQSTVEDDHFLILYLIGGGLDNHYWFDPKSKALTAANLKANYLPGTDEECRREIQDARGLKSFCTPLVEPLWKDWKGCLSILRGVYTSTNADGHENNLTMLLTGNTSASSSFLPALSSGVFLDFIQSGLVKDLVQNTGGGANLSPQLVANLLRTMGKASRGDASTRGDRFIEARFGAISAEGLLGQGSRRAQEVFGRRKQVGEVLARFRPQDYAKLKSESPQVRFLPVMRDAFQNKLCRVAIIRDAGIAAIDSHSAPAAKALPGMSYPPIVRNIQKMMGYLRDTPYDNRRSLLDVSTVLITSEFNRTYRSLVAGEVDVTNTGTDHNTFGNFAMLGGKGIKPGIICGETDLSEVGPDRKFVGVSRAHTTLDPLLAKACGLPFDFERLQAIPFIADAPFDKTRHLNYNSVINTLLRLFSVKSFEAKIEGTSTKAPVLERLLA